MALDKVICINASNRPNEIPTTKWLEKDKIYTVEKAGKDYAGVLFLFLKELEGTPPYLGFRADRFRPIDESPSLEDININELTKILELETAI